LAVPKAPCPHHNRWSWVELPAIIVRRPGTGSRFRPILRIGKDYFGSGVAIIGKHRKYRIDKDFD
jgi:hypothetical protein